MERPKHDDRHKKPKGFLQEYGAFLLIGILIVILLLIVGGILVEEQSRRRDPSVTRTEKSQSDQDKDRPTRKPWIPEETTTEYHIPSSEATTEEEKSLTKDEFYQALVDMGKKIQEKDLAYRGSAGHKTFEGATDFNCSLYVSWTLQELGLIPEGNTFWFNHKGHGSAYKYVKKHRERFEIYHPNCAIKESARLQPGDICGMEINGYAPHTAVYAGKDEKGRMLWYSAGRTDFRKMAKKHFKPIRFRYYEQKNDMLYTIVRIKFNEMEKKE